jgi:hypothetical protein
VAKKNEGDDAAMQCSTGASESRERERERELVGQKKAPANRLFIVSLLPVPDSGSFGLSYFFRKNGEFGFK